MPGSDETQANVGKTPLEIALEKARVDAAQPKDLSPAVKDMVKQMETEAIAQIFQPKPSPPEDKRRIVAVGGRIDGQDFLNADGIKDK